MRHWTSVYTLIYFIACITSGSTRRFSQRDGWSDVWPGPHGGKRLSLDKSATVYAWPSIGGRLELRNPSAFELEVLGIEDASLEINCSADFGVEDAFAYKLRSLGGTFSEHSYLTKGSPLDREEVHTWLGWPQDEAHKGGVWVLALEERHTWDRKTGRIRLARTMEERCRAIELCGGTFYPTVGDEHLVPMEPLPNIDRAEAESRQRRMEELGHSGPDRYEL